MADNSTAALEAGYIPSPISSSAVVKPSEDNLSSRQSIEHVLNGTRRQFDVQISSDGSDSSFTRDSSGYAENKNGKTKSTLKISRPPEGIQDVLDTRKSSNTTMSQASGTSIDGVFLAESVPSGFSFGISDVSQSNQSIKHPNRENSSSIKENHAEAMNGSVNGISKPLVKSKGKIGSNSLDDYNKQDNSEILTEVTKTIWETNHFETEEDTFSVVITTSKSVQQTVCDTSADQNTIDEYEHLSMPSNFIANDQDDHGHSTSPEARNTIDDSENKITGDPNSSVLFLPSKNTTDPKISRETGHETAEYHEQTQVETKETAKSDIKIDEWFQESSNTNDRNIEEMLAIYYEQKSTFNKRMYGTEEGSLVKDIDLLAQSKAEQPSASLSDLLEERFVMYRNRITELEDWIEGIEPIVIKKDDSQGAKVRTDKECKRQKAIPIKIGEKVYLKKAFQTKKKATKSKSTSSNSQQHDNCQTNPDVEETSLEPVKKTKHKQKTQSLQSKVRPNSSTSRPTSASGVPRENSLSHSSKFLMKSHCCFGPVKSSSVSSTTPNESINKSLSDVKSSGYGGKYAALHKDDTKQIRVRGSKTTEDVRKDIKLLKTLSLPCRIPMPIKSQLTSPGRISSSDKVFKWLSGCNTGSKIPVFESRFRRNNASQAGIHGLGLPIMSEQDESSLVNPNTTHPLKVEISPSQDSAFEVTDISQSDHVSVKNSEQSLVTTKSPLPGDIEKHQLDGKERPLSAIKPSRINALITQNSEETLNRHFESKKPTKKLLKPSPLVVDSANQEVVPKKDVNSEDSRADSQLCTVDGNQNISASGKHLSVVPKRKKKTKQSTKRGEDHQLKATSSNMSLKTENTSVQESSSTGKKKEKRKTSLHYFKFELTVRSSTMGEPRTGEISRTKGMDESLNTLTSFSLPTPKTRAFLKSNCIKLHSRKKLIDCKLAPQNLEFTPNVPSPWSLPEDQEKTKNEATFGIAPKPPSQERTTRTRHKTGQSKSIPTSSDGSLEAEQDRFTTDFSTRETNNDETLHEGLPRLSEDRTSLVSTDRPKMMTQQCNPNQQQANHEDLTHTVKSPGINTMQINIPRVDIPPLDFGESLSPENSPRPPSASPREFPIFHPAECVRRPRPTFVPPLNLDRLDDEESSSSSGRKKAACSTKSKTPFVEGVSETVAKRRKKKEPTDQTTIYQQNNDTRKRETMKHENLLQGLQKKTSTIKIADADKTNSLDHEAQSKAAEAACSSTNKKQSKLSAASRFLPSLPRLSLGSKRNKYLKRDDEPDSDTNEPKPPSKSRDDKTTKRRSFHLRRKQ
uniref:Uncharacterized protein n=1 Tax=Clytia hemisphaerica TaxID=252671 RepID=A0A7M5WS01_9CNID